MTWRALSISPYRSQPRPSFSYQAGTWRRWESWHEGHSQQTLYVVQHPDFRVLVQPNRVQTNRVQISGLLVVLTPLVLVLSKPNLAEAVKSGC